MLKGYTAPIFSHWWRCSCGGSARSYGSQQIGRARRAPAQPEKYQPGDPAQLTDSHHRAVRFGQIFARFRHHLCRRPAPLRRIALRLRPAISRSDGTPRSGLNRRPFPLHRHRAKNHDALPALHGWHHHRNLRLPPRGLRLRSARRIAPIAASPSPASPPNKLSKPSCMANLQARRPHHDPRADRPRPQRRLSQGTRKACPGRLRPRPHQWRASPAGRPPRSSTSARITPSKSSSTVCWSSRASPRAWNNPSPPP